MRKGEVILMKKRHFNLDISTEGRMDILRFHILQAFILRGTLKDDEVHILIRGKNEKKFTAFHSF